MGISDWVCKIAVVILAVTLSACSRDMDNKKTTLSFQLPNSGKAIDFDSQKSSSSLSATDWAQSDPTAYDEINCYAVFVSGPGLDKGQCVRSDKSVAFSVGFLAGLFPAGSQVELDVPSGPNRTVRLIGLTSFGEKECVYSAKEALPLADMSAPFEMGKVTTDLIPDVVNKVAIQASLSASGKFHSCQGEGVGFGPLPVDVVTGPTVILGGLPGAQSNAMALNVSISGDVNLVSYQYKLGLGSLDCSSSSGYGAWLEVSSNITDSLAGFADGPLKLCALGGDSQGLHQDLMSATSYSWVKDTAIPSVGFASPAYGSFVHSGNVSTFSVTGSCSENGQSVNLSGTSSTTVTCHSGSWSASLDYSGAADGSVTLTASHSDLAGNTGSVSTGFVKDTSGPTAASVSISGGAGTTTETSVTVNLAATDAAFMYITNTAGCATGGTWESYAATKSWTLLGGVGGSTQTVYVQFKDTSGNHSVCLSDTITYTPPALLMINDAVTKHFGNVAVGGSSVATLTISNTGYMGATSMSDPSSLASPYQFLGGSYPGTGGSCGATLAGGSNCTLVIEYSPVGVGVTSDGVQIDYNDGAAANSVSLAVQGNGSSPAILAVSGGAPPYDFGTHAVGSSVIQVFTVNNTGAVSATGMSGSGLSGSFQFTGGAYPGGTGTCGGSLAAGANCTIEVTYSPASTGAHAATMSLPYNDGAGAQFLSHDVVGTGATPASLVITEADPYDYGVRGVGFPLSHIFTLTNVGGFQASSLNDTTLAAPFEYTGGTYPGTAGTCGPTLNAGANCDIEVRFDPAAAGLATSTIQIDYDNGAGAVNATRDVQGTGFQPYNMMALGHQHTCGRHPGGTGYCWGLNSSGQLGDNTTTSATSPVQLNGPTNWVNLSAYGNHMCAVASGGNGYCWGSNGNGQVGDNTTTDRSVPTSLPGGAVWQKVATGSAHSCGLKTNGNIECWGNNLYGKVGDGTTTHRMIPTAISSGSSFIDVALGDNTSCAVDSTNAVQCWGRGDSGQLGNDSTTDSSTPVGASILANSYSRVVVGMNFACALRTTGGFVECWGGGTAGQLGDGNSTDAISAAVTVTVSGFTKIVAGDLSVCGFKSSTNEIYCWGQNTYGQIGNGTTTAQGTPVMVGNDYMDVWSGKYHVCGMTINGQTRCWGSNAQGQLGDGTTVDKLSPVTIN